MALTDSGCHKPSASSPFEILFGCRGRRCCSSANAERVTPAAKRRKRQHRTAALNMVGPSLLDHSIEGALSMYRSLCIVFLITCVSCSTTQPTTTTNMSNSADFEKLIDDVLYGALALAPVAATQTGYHEHNGMPLDEMVDDYSQAGIDNQRKFYEGVQSRVNALNAGSLDKEQTAYLEIIKNQLKLQLLDLNTIQSFKHNPTVYVELAGNALY